MGDELLKLFKLPFILLGMVIKAVFLIFIFLVIIVLVFSSGDSIRSKIDNAMNRISSNDSVTIQSYYSVPSNSEYVLHTLRPGDSLQKLAQKYNVSVKTIIQLNNISRVAPLHSGMILYIPQYTDYYSNSSSTQNKKDVIIFL